MIWSNIELYNEPRTACVSEMAFPKGEPEMSDFESAFLCGLIKERKPQKIVEVGVAGGGTTAIILRCLDMLNLVELTEFYSVDLSERFYKNEKERTGYLADSLLKRKKYKHHFVLGHLLPDVIEDIAGDIDFVILDTSHSMPGEILDFLTIYPYLQKDACVVLHDIAYHHYSMGIMCFPTQLLFSCVNADKVIMKDQSRAGIYPNIGAFVINNGTEGSLVNVLNSMMITWQELMPREEFVVYHQYYFKTYGEEFANLFEIIYNLQNKTTPKLIYNRGYYKKAKKFLKILKMIG